MQFSYGNSKPMSLILFEKHGGPDGFIERHAFHALVKNLGHAMDEETEEVAWVSIELDGDGKISYEEFATWWTTDDRWAHLQLSEAEIANLVQVHDYFRYYDQSSTGTLTKLEFSNVYSYMTESGYLMDDFEDVFEEIDTDKDGTINYNEFIVWMVGIGVLVNSDIKQIAIRHHRESMRARLVKGEHMTIRSLLVTVNEMGGALLATESSATACCESLSSLLSFVQDGVGLTGKVFFEEDGANQYNPVVLALGVFSKQNNNLFDTLSRDVFVKGTDYDICIKLMERLLEAIQEEEQKTSGKPFQPWSIAMNHYIIYYYYGLTCMLY